ncbi:phage gp6-like head-tail connector protein [Bosea sp. SSUT16]|uniref:Phage gp6-like head-tail connector protein n=1 Tax=Bosea spartocytisi TaxID=2773451 RepID=A0A927EA19_9HYPH|nr:head-tail connector protein [Bosea spartocytisi]MBD3847103.1 phage gp6-like head-tail connector protein [Bosea spartocytisi]MCT4474201.1 head-tail connector protein [Bosea spartocytisi]
MPKVIVVVRPESILPLDLVKQHLRIDHSAEDALLQTYIAAATEEIDGPDGWLGVSLGRQTLEWQGDSFPADGSSPIMLPCGPVFQIVSVSYTDRDGGSQSFADHELFGQDLFVKRGSRWPSTICRPAAARIRYESGHVQEAVPTPVIQALLIMVEDFWERRAVDGPMHPTAARLLAPRRVWI